MPISSAFCEIPNSPPQHFSRSRLVATPEMVAVNNVGHNVISGALLQAMAF